MSAADKFVYFSRLRETILPRLNFIPLKDSEHSCQAIQLSNTVVKVFFFPPSIFFLDALSFSLVITLAHHYFKTPTTLRVLRVVNSSVHTRQASYCMLKTEYKWDSHRTNVRFSFCSERLWIDYCFLKSSDNCPLKVRKEHRVPNHVVSWRLDS